MPNNYFHMTPTELKTGDVRSSSGFEQIDTRIEAALEKFRPKDKLSRLSSVYCAIWHDFTRTGVTSDGYIYLVDLQQPELHDLSWLAPMQAALLREKHPSLKTSKKLAGPDWSDSMVEEHCRNYWSGKASADPAWEAVAPKFTVVERLSDRLVQRSETADGWPQLRERFPKP